ncbi:MAG: respiratory nitrate reductase subunit gamma [Kofleriaceae bacterium]
MTFDRLVVQTRALRVVIALVLGLRVLLFGGSASADPAEAKKIFTTRCMACHTFGKGVKVGPDLKGVTERRQRPWLLKFIRSSQTVIGSGDPIASGLFEQFKQQRMPDWSDLSEAQIGSILDWLAVSGPDQQEPDARSAESATLAEIATGRALFHGGQAFARGGVACASCHSIRDEDGSQRGGTLASELTNAYSLFQDGAMTQFLRRPCFQRFPESTLAAFLAPQESFAVKAYLRETALSVQSQILTTQGGAPVVAKTIDNEGGGAAGTTTHAPAPAASATKRVAWAPRQVSKPPRADELPNELLFLVFPYAAVLVLLVGLGVRHAMARRQPETLRTAASDAWRIFRGNLAWRIGLGVTALLHLAGLLVPGAVLAWNGVSLRLYLLEGSGFVLGAITLVGLVQIMWRHVGRSIAADTRGDGLARVPEIADYALLSLGCVAVVSGLVSAVLYRWGSSWAIATLVPYMRSLAVGAPASELVEQMPFLVRLHVFTWFAMLALLPFTSLAMILVSAGDRVLLVVARPIASAGGAGRRVLGRFSPARWIWPEEDPVAPAADNAQEPS